MIKDAHFNLNTQNDKVLIDLARIDFKINQISQQPMFITKS